MAVILSISCTKELHQLVKDKNISPSEAFRRGVREMLRDPMPFDPTVKFTESDLNKAQQVQKTMQSTIDFLNRKIDLLQGKKLPLDDGKNTKLT